MTEWKPVNPCDTCAEKPCSFGCMPYAGYYDSIKAQRKLLEYLIATASGGHLQGEMDGFDRDAIGLPELESMLKELEVKQ